MASLRRSIVQWQQKWQQDVSALKGAALHQSALRAAEKEQHVSSRALLFRLLSGSKMLPAAELIAAGLSPTELRMAGFSAAELKAAGCSSQQLKEAGFLPRQLRHAGVLLSDCFTLDELLAIGDAGADCVEVECRFESAFDTHGALHHIATRGGTREYQNPYLSGDVVASASSLVYGDLEDLVAHAHTGTVYAKVAVCCTENKLNSWVAVDLGAGRSLRPSHYNCLDSGRAPKRSTLCSEMLQGSNDGTEWTTLEQRSRWPKRGRGWPVEGIGDSFRAMLQGSTTALDAAPRIASTRG